MRMDLRGWLRASRRMAALPIVIAGGLAALHGVAGAAGAWQTILRARDFTDLLVTEDVVWCATAEAGLLRYDRGTGTFDVITREPGSIASNHLRALRFDRIGRLWVGTAGSGVSRLAVDGVTWELISRFDGLPKDSVTTITAVGETLWIGTRGGIALWDGRRVLGSLPDGNTVSFDTTFVLPAITGVVQLSDTLWLSTPRGVGFGRTTTGLTDWRKANAGLPSVQVVHMVSDGRSIWAQAAGAVYRWSEIPARWVSEGALGVVHTLREDYGVVLAATSLGIWQYRPATDSFELIPDSPVTVSGDDPEPAIGPGSSPVLFAGSRDGLAEKPAAPGAWTVHSPGGPPGNIYNNVVIDGPRVYAATRGQGIGRWDGTSWYNWLPGDCFDCPNAFRNANEVFAMVVDTTGRKWVACWGYAIDRFDDASDPAFFTHYWTGAEEVPHTAAFGAALDSSGGVWFGMDTYNPELFGALGLDFYDSTGVYAATWSPGGSRLRGGGKIRAITVDKTGRIWVGYAGTIDSGVDHFVRRPEIGYDFKSVDNTFDMDIWSIVAYGDSIWVLTDRNLRRIHRTSVPPRLSPTIYDTPAGRPLGLRLMDVAPSGDVFVGSENGVRWYRRDGSTEDFTATNSALAANEVRAIAVDRTTGVVWIGTADGLNRFDPGYRPPEPPPVARDSLHIYPNPATLTGLGVELRLLGAFAGYVGGIYDLRGRLLHRFVTTSRGHVFWDGRDPEGEPVKPGVYFVLAANGGREARGRFVLLH
jgi:hypothetical protein